ncbi:MAG: methionine adenosyltransferase domain-containing protein, partial [Spirochaetaceae bacterium]|nr:methionine adenosyltransferase domain-containing protein [Spirochaetaceae bacterium]
SAAYMARYIAKNLVAAGIAEELEVQLAYAIGVSEPVSLYVNTFGTGQIEESRIEKIIPDIFDLSPAGIIDSLNLKRAIYRETAAYGHFGRREFPWEKTDKVELIRSAVN